MGMLDRLRNFFNGSNNAPENNTLEMRADDSYRKSILISQITNSIDKIKRINSFDSSIWNLSNTSSYELQRKSMAELEQIKASLDNRVESLTRQSQRRNPEREALEASKWTGQKPKNLTNYEFDRAQRDDPR